MFSNLLFKDFIIEFNHERCIITRLLTLFGFSFQIRKWCIIKTTAYGKRQDERTRARKGQDVLFSGGNSEFYLIRRQIWRLLCNLIISIMVLQDNLDNSVQIGENLQKLLKMPKNAFLGVKMTSQGQNGLNFGPKNLQ